MKKSQKNHKKSTKKIAPEKLNDVSGGNTAPRDVVLPDRQRPKLRDIMR